MKKLLLIIIVIIVSCNSAKQTDSGNIKQIWMLTEFSSFTKEYLSEKKAFLNLTGNKTAPVYMGCNNMSFPYSISGNKTISFSIGIATRMYCEDMKLEREFSSEISKISKYQIKGNQLFLTSENGTKMVFTAKGLN